MTLYIEDETGLATKDSNEAYVYTFDYDIRGNLPVGVMLTSMGTFTIEVEQGSNSAPLTKDNEALVTGSRKTSLRLLAGTPGTIYVIRNLVTTNETPAQTKEKSFRLLIKS